jgi:hypothetical protein
MKIIYPFFLFFIQLLFTQIAYSQESHVNDLPTNEEPISGYKIEYLDSNLNKVIELGI